MNEPRNIMLSETGQSQKDKCYKIPHIGESKIVKLIEAEKRTMVAKGTMESCYSTSIKFHLHKMNMARALLYNVLPVVNNTLLFP